jgi:hypothetical protein
MASKMAGGEAGYGYKIWQHLDENTSNNPLPFFKKVCTS